MLTLATQWVWDFWFADDGHRYHLFFLHAPRDLQDPDLRHWNARIGHATSADLINWSEEPDALAPGPAGSFDDRATWTGSVVQHPDGTWWMFYTGASSAENGLVQRIGVATSPDLYTWTADRNGALVTTDSRWYEQLAAGAWFDEAWRDPWVYWDDQTCRWQMLVTARSNSGAPDDRGVIGLATSPDLAHWTVQPPLTTVGSGFGYLEVPQLHTVQGRQVLIFSCPGSQLAQHRQLSLERGGIWAIPYPPTSGGPPWNLTGASLLTDESFYSGRLINTRDGHPVLLAFHNVGDDGFVGTISDPMPVHWNSVGELAVTATAVAGTSTALLSPATHP